MMFGTRTIRIKTIILLFVCLLALFACPAHAEEDTVASETKQKEGQDWEYVDPETHFHVWIKDAEELLTGEEKDRLLEEMKPIAKYGNVAFESYASWEDGESYCKRHYLAYGFFAESGTVFLINMDKRYMWLYTGGRMEKIISAKRAVSITDNVYRYASDGDYYQCAAEVFRQENILLKGGFILQPMRLICCFFIAFGISLLSIYLFICKERGIKSGIPEQAVAATGAVTLAGKAYVMVTKRVSNSGGGGFSGGGGGGFSGGGGGFSGGGHSF